MLQMHRVDHTTSIWPYSIECNGRFHGKQLPSREASTSATQHVCKISFTLPVSLVQVSIAEVQSK